MLLPRNSEDSFMTSEAMHCPQHSIHIIQVTDHDVYKVFLGFNIKFPWPNMGIIISMCIFAHTRTAELRQ